MTRISFHCGWKVGLTVCVCLCSASALESVEEEENVDGSWTGVLSILAIIRDVFGSASAPEVIIFRPAVAGSFGLAGPTPPCCDSNDGGRTLKSLYSSRILTANRSRELMGPLDPFEPYNIIDTRSLALFLPPCRW